MAQIAILDAGIANGVKASVNTNKTSITPRLVSSEPTFGTTVFNPRFTIPEKTDKNWLKYSRYGYNHAIELEGWENRYTVGSCLPNCVGYAWGRVYEISKKYNTELPTTAKLSVGNAGSWYNHNKNAYKRGSVPRLGAVACYSSKSYGHVLVIEQIEYDKYGKPTKARYSESWYSRKNFTTGYLYASNNWHYCNGYTLQGFIYPPYTALFSPDAGEEYAGGSAQNTICLNLSTVLVKDGTTGKYIQGNKSNYSSTLPGIPDTELVPNAKPAKFSAGKKVKIKDKGNSSKLGTGKEVVCTGAIYSIKSYHPGFPYPYRVGDEKGGIGYFPETALEFV